MGCGSSRPRARDGGARRRRAGSRSTSPSSTCGSAQASGLDLLPRLLGGAPRPRRRRHHRLRHLRHRGRGDQARRARLPAEALHAGADPPRRRAAAASAGPSSGASPTSRRRLAQRGARGRSRDGVAADAGGARRHPAGGAATTSPVLLRGRERHRQGRAGPRAPRPERPRGGAVRHGELPHALRGAARERAVRPRAGRLHRRGARPGRARSRRPRAAPSSSTRSARCRRRCRRSCCASCRRSSSSAWARPARAAPTCAWSRPPTATSRPTWRRAGSARTCSTGSTWSRCRCRRCASAPRTSARWRGASSRFFARAAGAPRPSSRPKRWRRCCAYPWPGNVRELRNAIERAVILWPAQVARAARRCRSGSPRTAALCPARRRLHPRGRSSASTSCACSRAPPRSRRPRAILGIDASTLWRKRKKYEI